MKYVPPWREPYFIGVAGCSGSGKTSITRELIQKLNTPWTVLLSMDNFYKALNEQERELAFKSEYDFDNPEFVDFDLLTETLLKLKRGEKAEVPIYSFVHHNRTDEKMTLYGANVVIIEGIYALYDPRVLDLLNLKVFVYEDYDVCMARRLHRDILYRGRELKLSIKQWHRFVKPNYLAKILPTAKNSNLLIPKGIENEIAINMLFEFMRQQLREKSLHHLQELRLLGTKSQLDEGSWVSKLKPTNQVLSLQTMIANKDCDRESFIFAVDRLSRRLITEVFDHVCSTANLAGAAIEDRLCITTMVSGGEVFESAIRQLLPDIFVGRLLIMSDLRSGEPALHLCKVPSWIGSATTKVILTEAQIISGAAAVMGIAVLVDHGVKPENITFCALVASEIGARRIHDAFPEVHLFFGTIGQTPPILSIDKRYYGTE